MPRPLKSLHGIIILLCLKLVLGIPVSAFNFSCVLYPDGDGVCELVREVLMKADDTNLLKEGYSSKKITVKLELDYLIERKIKDFITTNNIFGNKQKEKTDPNKKVPIPILRLHKPEEQRIFRRSVPQSDLEISSKSNDSREVNNEHSEIERMRTELDAQHKELLYLEDKIKKNISSLESEKQYLKGKISKFKENIFAEERARIQLEDRVEEVFEIFCSYIFITEKRVKVEIPLTFREKLWSMCSKKYEFQKNFMPVTYKEMEDINASCPRRDSCAMIRNSDSLTEYNCQCGFLCSTLDTCCFDSPYRGIQSSDGPSQSCQSVYGVLPLAFYMVDECPKNASAGDAWKNLCKNGEENNLMTYVPVTSTRTKLTYKNYYCFACHETTDDYYFWEVEVRSQRKIDTLRSVGNPIIEYDTILKRWMGQNSEQLKDEYVLIWVNKPSEIQHLVTDCRKEVISKCHDNWPDDITRYKCNAYTAMITFKGSSHIQITYKNPHCAICNFESLNRMRVDCDYIKPPLEIPYFFDDEKLPHDPHFNFEAMLKQRFSNTNFFTISQYRNCPVNSIWNPFSHMCSPLKCQEGYSLKNRACISS